jgi:hypothetical protein
MQFLGSHPGGAPATHKEAEALRSEATGGDAFGPSNTEDLLRGFKSRYNFVPTRLPPGPDSIRGALKPGTIATVSGHLSNLPANHPLQTSPGFTGGHRWCVLNDGSAKVLVLDPLHGPKEEPRYRGDRATIEDVAKFANNGDRHTISRLATTEDAAAKKEGMVQFVNLREFGARTGRRVTVPKGTPIMLLDGSRLLATERQLTLPVYGQGDAQPSQLIVEITTRRVYSDGVARPTLVLINSPTPNLVDVPADNAVD